MARGVRHEDIPSSEDPIWSEWAERVFAVLPEPQNLEQLKDWARKESFEVGKLVNTLAWMAMRGMVKTSVVGGTLTWTRVPPKVKPPPQPLPRACPKCGGRLYAEPDRLVCLICGRSIYPPIETD